MSDEHDSWFQDVFGLDLGGAAKQFKDVPVENIGTPVENIGGPVVDIGIAVMEDETGLDKFQPHLDPIHPEHDKPRPQPKPKGPPSSSMPVLRKGSSGPAVNDLQLLLNQKGASLKVDGDFGTNTETAVKDFQGKAGLEVDGIVGRNTWDALSSGKRVSPDPKPDPKPPLPPDTKPRAVIFTVTSEANNNAVPGATVSVAGQSEKTGNMGQATFSLAPGTYPFAVDAEGLKRFAGNIEVTTDKDTKNHVELKGGGQVPLQSITIQPVNPPPLAAREKQQFTATDDTGADVTSQVLWSSSDPNIVTIDARGLATAKDVSGTASITATIAPPVGEASKALVAAPKPAAASTTVKVSGSASDKVLVKITISPSGSTMMRHVKQKFTATGVFADRSEDKNLAVEWESSKPRFLEIDKKTGVAVAKLGTTAVITAKAGGVVSDPATVTIVQLESIAIIPKGPQSILRDLQIDFSAVATFTGGEPPRPFAAEWESSADHIISINHQTGRAISKSKGTATIKANAGKADPSIGAEVTVTVLEGSGLPEPSEKRDFADLRRELQSAMPLLKQASDAEDRMVFVAAQEKVDLENPKPAVAGRPPSKLSDQDKINLQTSFTQVDQARVQKARIVHEMQATTRELVTAIEVQRDLAPPDPALAQEHKNVLGTQLEIVDIVVDGISKVAHALEKGFSLPTLGLALIETELAKKGIEKLNGEIEHVEEKIKELGEKLEKAIKNLETIKGAFAAQIRNLRERSRVERDDFAEQTKVYRKALRDYEKLVLKVAPKAGGAPGFQQTVAAVLSASQTSLSARSELNTPRLQPNGAKVILADLRNPGEFQKQLTGPEVALFLKDRKVFCYLGETEKSLKDLAEQVQKVIEFYKSTARIDRFFQAWQDALEE